ncbi:MAG: TetR family transcriptional regulator [Candidatus Delongbacteria bacterium]|nr:TetR family transcriptional regulator [Candidatus Delongbacteria bacterium]
MNKKSSEKTINQPKQARSIKTMNNLLDTAQQMLIDSTFDKSNIQEIVKKANSSVGSFYSLFKSKSNLLETLLDRYMDWLIDLAKDFNTNKKNLIPDIEKRAELFINKFIKVNRQEAGMLRARFIYKLTNEDSVPAARLEKNKIFLIEMMKYFEPCIGQINNPKPEEALIFILELIDIYIGEKIMFEADRKVSYKKLREECLRLFINYLGIKYS